MSADIVKPDIARRQVLVVDDDDSVRASLCRLLESEGYSVRSAAGLREAQELLNSFVVDLVVLDINLGFESGWDVFRQVAAADRFIPVVIVTGEWGQHDTAVELGAEALLEKPIDVPVFLETLQDLLTQAEKGASRRPGRPDYCRFVPRHHESMQRLFQERLDAPANH